MERPAVPPLTHLQCSVARKLRRAATSWLWLIGFFLLAFAVQAYAQGCSQCLDSTRATPPAVQAGYRHAIYVLGGAGLALFLAGLYIFRRES